MKTYILLLNILLLSFSACQKNQATLYNYARSENITLSKSSDLGLYKFDDKAYSACVSGLMLFYSQREFEGRMEYVFGREKHCVNEFERVYYGVSSLRFPGCLEDIRKASLTLYAGRVFTGRDYYVSGNFFSGTESWSSLIVTGGNNWTVFDSADHEGNAACLVPPDPLGETPGFVPSAVEIPRFEQWIVSGKIGCNNNSTDNIFHLIPFAQQGYSRND